MFSQLQIWCVQFSAFGPPSPVAFCLKPEQHITAAMCCFRHDGGAVITICLIVVVTDGTCNCVLPIYAPEIDELPLEIWNPVHVNRYEPLDFQSN